MSTETPKKDLFDLDPALFETHKAAVKAIVQAAVNVELFTIPLYMTTLYSIQGTHQITGANNLYQGRLWPGLAPAFRPEPNVDPKTWANQRAFNTIFSVFIEEMLHLQLASNIATALGIVPKFTELSPTKENYAWQCYSGTKLPGIVDLQDCENPPNTPPGKRIDYANIKVKLDELNMTQNDLFLAIEAPEAEAKARVKEDKRHLYFPVAPFKDWKKGDELSMFGSIGHMYQCLWDYLDITYKDAEGTVTTLWQKMYKPAAIQQDIFNTVSQGHPYREFQGLETTISGWLPEKAKELVFKLICAITDQGEGADISKNLRGQVGYQAVQEVNQASLTALKADYPSFTDTGEKTKSTHAYARFHTGSEDHYERFEAIRTDLLDDKIVTWPKWHKDVRPGAVKWTEDDLKTATYAENKYGLPEASAIAGALNRLNYPSGTVDPTDKKREANYQQFCEIATGAIAGITTVLNDYWEKPGVGFPFPSMGGSGDRLMMCWAVFGQVPDLSRGVQPIEDGKLYHACQGLDLNRDAAPDNVCASPQIYHNCRGSNSCKAQGGCGFVQQAGQTKSCGSSVMSVKMVENLCPSPGPKPTPAGDTWYTAPGDNMCKAYGGCAVPISASQIYPVITLDKDKKPVTEGSMSLLDFGAAPDFEMTPLKAFVNFKTGDFVHDIAWEAYLQVMKARHKQPQPKPAPSDIRLAFPPST